MKTIPKNELFQSGDPFKMSFSNLLSLLRDGGPFLLRAWAENSDPKLEKYQVIIDKKSQAAACTLQEVQQMPGTIYS